MRTPAGSRRSRRQFLSSVSALSLVGVLPGGLRAQATGGDDPRSSLAADPRRPQFHLLPARNWMNDPNGPIYSNGSYHMFFQYNPQGATWGDMSWDHAISPDMLHWKHLPLAMTPTPASPDAFGCFSGTAIHVASRVYVVYTGTVKSTPEVATLRDGNSNLLETQCLAWSDDSKLETWHKDPQPIIPTVPPGMKVTGFRDPSVWKQGKWFYMVVGSGIAEVGGCVLLYRSPASGDLRTWEYLHPLTSGSWNGKKTQNPCDDGEMWECPDFFALDGGHVLIYSTLGKVFWQSGHLHEQSMKFTANKTGLLDLDAFYAPKTQLDANGRRILWGWIPERRSDDAMRQAGWSGMMSLPRLLNLDPDGTLRMRVLPQATALRGAAIASTSEPLGELCSLREACAELICTGSRGKDFELTIGKPEMLHISYSAATHSFTANGHSIALETDDLPAVHAFVDGSVIEVIFSERAAFTLRFYYEGNTAPDLPAHARGAGVRLTAWQVTPISPDRLTTPASRDIG